MEMGETGAFIVVDLVIVLVQTAPISLFMTILLHSMFRVSSAMVGDS
jgi:hypothetical protein